MIEWDIPYTLTTPAGTLEFNTPTTVEYSSDGARFVFLLDEEKCKGTPGPLRVEVDDTPQSDGSLIRPSFLHGYTVQLGVRMWVQSAADSAGVDARSPACGSDLRVMWDTLILHLNALKNPSLLDLVSQCRLVYTPSGAVEDRMADQLQLIAWPDPSKAVPETSADFTMQSTLPYELDEEQLGPFSVGSSALPYGNSGNTETFPVFIVTAVGAPLTQFTIENQTIGQSIIYDADLPDAPAIAPGNYAEINTFRNTIYLNGSGANLKSGIDVLSSDFFPLIPQPDTNMLQFTHTGGSATCEILYNTAWAN